MEKLPPYPLEQVMEVKEKRVREAEREVANRKKMLEAEQAKLQEFIAEMNKVKKHYSDKMKQMRDELDTGTTSDKIMQMKHYLKLVEEKVLIEKEKVEKQEKQVEEAQNNLNLAKAHHKQKQKEVDKLVAHKEMWTKEATKEMLLEMTKQEDEIGSIIHQNRRRSQK